MNRILLAALAAALIMALSFATPAAAFPESSADGVVTLKLDRSQVNHGASVSVRGLARPSLRGTVRRQSVRLKFRPIGSRKWHRVQKVGTDGQGRYRVRLKVNRNGQIRAVSSDGQGSVARRITVRSRLMVAGVRPVAKVGKRVLIRGAVKPGGRRRIKVVVRGAERSVLKTTTRYHGGFAVTFRPRRSGQYSVRVFAAHNAAAASDRGRLIRLTGLRPTHASYYGPGLYGNGMACGGTLTTSTRGVAHKTLPCGTRVTLRYGTRTVKVRVIDRGPYVAGREFDLTEATRNDLGFGSTGTVWTNR